MIRAGQVGREVSGGHTRWDEKGRTMISHIFVSFNEFITSIQFGYLEDGALVLSGMHGPSYPQRSFRAVTLNQDEYVTGLSGILGPSGRIISLTFHTSRGKHGPIGCSGDNFGASCSKIEIEPAIRDRREFGGFFGSYNGHCLSSIGIYVSPIARSDTVVKREKS